MTTQHTPQQRTLQSVATTWLPEIVEAMDALCIAVAQGLPVSALDPSTYLPRTPMGFQADPVVIMAAAVSEKVSDMTGWPHSAHALIHHSSDMGQAIMALWAIADGCWESADPDMPLVSMGTPNGLAERWAEPVTFYPVTDMLAVGNTWATMERGYIGLEAAAVDWTLARLSA